MGEDAIDLATALDQYEEESDGEPQAPNRSESDQSLDEEEDPTGSEESTSSDSEDDDDSDDQYEEQDEDADPEKLNALRGLISGYGGEEEQNADDTPASRQKVSLNDLGLAGLKDQYMNNAVKLMKKEDKESRPGVAKKLDVPLAPREQARLDRSAAYETTNETLQRWGDTVKQNRRAEHLVFPLPQNSAMAGLDTSEIQPLRAKDAGNELEAAVFSIMEQSGLSMDRPSKPKEQQYDEDGNVLSRKEIQNRKRMERELNSREAKRARRIKKIKSKAYHRVHRKQRERDGIAAEEAMKEAGEVDSEEEREAQDRRRALERVGQRHKESKWAKLGSKNKRAVWDDDFRAGLTEMARKDEELRRRKEGKAVDSDDETSSSGSDDDDGAALLRQLNEMDDDEADEPQSQLMSMKFMQKAEAAKKQANDEVVRQIRRDLGGEDAEDSPEDEREEVGRRQYGAPDGKPIATAVDTANRGTKKGRLSDSDSVNKNGAVASPGGVRQADGASQTAFVSAPVSGSSAAGAWSRGESRRKKGASGGKMETLDLNSSVMVASQASGPKPRMSSSDNPRDADDDSDFEAERHMPLAIRDGEMVARAFAGEDVVGEFEREKREIAEEDDDKVVDNTIPGWGSWVGEGISKREMKRNQGRFMTKVEGVKKKTDRRDARLDKVIISEKRVKKVPQPLAVKLSSLPTNTALFFLYALMLFLLFFVLNLFLDRSTWDIYHANAFGTLQNDRYLASQLPHPFESRQQYERSMRLPVGPEWMTKETFQESTKPRVLMKPGIITPMSKPMV